MSICIFSKYPPKNETDNDTNHKSCDDDSSADNVPFESHSKCNKGEEICKGVEQKKEGKGNNPRNQWPNCWYWTDHANKSGECLGEKTDKDNHKSYDLFIKSQWGTDNDKKRDNKPYEDEFPVSNPEAFNPFFHYSLSPPYDKLIVNEKITQECSFVKFFLNE